jgi:PAS domain S-box-containing protein
MVIFDIQEQILEKLNALVVVINREGQAEYVSQSAEKLLGFPADSLTGNRWWELTRFSRSEGEDVRRRILELMDRNGGSVETFEHRFKTAYGGQKWIRWNVSFDDDEHVIGIGYDVTDKKVREKQLVDGNTRLQQQNKEIRDSILYAQRIQRNSLQGQEYIRQIFSECFVMYKPKDLVSGDFYFFYEDEDNKYAIAADCTGHGVPGAMMSLVANSIIKEVLLNP